MQMLDRFVIDHAYPSWPVNRWISALFVLYRPHIEELLKKRDEIVWRWAEQHPGEDVFEDRNLDITSQMDISVTDFMGRIEREINARQNRS